MKFLVEEMICDSNHTVILMLFLHLY